MKSQRVINKQRAKAYAHQRYLLKKAEHEAVHGPKTGPNQWTVSHRMTGTSEYKSWVELRARCNDPKNKSFKHYGGRGITVCPTWSTFEQFYADMGPRPAGMTLDRRDNNGPYSKANCRWATPLEQTRNRRNAITLCLDGETLALQDWCRRFGADYSTVHSRIFKHGWELRRALTTPKLTRGGKPAVVDTPEVISA